jgi:hypothetical protein
LAEVPTAHHVPAVWSQRGATAGQTEVDTEESKPARSVSLAARTRCQFSCRRRVRDVGRGVLTFGLLSSLAHPTCQLLHGSVRTQPMIDEAWSCCAWGLAGAPCSGRWGQPRQCGVAKAMSGAVHEPAARGATTGP